jgi:hypothetical protein
MAKTLSTDVEAELIARHKATVKTVFSLLAAVVLLCVLGYVTQKFLTLRPNPSINTAFIIIAVAFGLGAVALRRTRFAQMRLQDIAAIQGPIGLIISLQRTTLLVALIGTAVAVAGFVSALMTGDASYSLRASVAAVLILLYGYPIRNAWQQTVRKFASYAIADPQKAD